MTQQMLILFAIFTESSKSPGQSVTAVGAQQAMAVFAFFLFVVYGMFGGMLSVFRQDIIKEGELFSFCFDTVSNSVCMCACRGDD